MTLNPLFKIDDYVETTEQYKKEIEWYNEHIFDTPAKTYFKGRITRVQPVTGEAAGDRPWICMTLDNDVGKMVNQESLQKVKELEKVE